MLRIGKTETVYNKGNKSCYEIQIFLNTLSDLKWANSYARHCHALARKQKNGDVESKDEIQLCYYFKHKTYLEKFIKELKKHISHEVISYE